MLYFALEEMNGVPSVLPFLQEISISEALGWLEQAAAR
jgi:hypothetical protein